MDDWQCGYIKQLAKNTLLSLQFVAELIFTSTDWWVFTSVGYNRGVL
jgi:hypothetical protein